MYDLEKWLSGGDLRSIGKSGEVVVSIQSQKDFDQLFKHLMQGNRLVVMRAADAIEKVTRNNPLYLFKHKKKVLEIFDTGGNKELKWHLALLVPRLPLENHELKAAWDKLISWSMDTTNSRIVRVNSIQGLFELLLLSGKSDLLNNLEATLSELEKENIPSLNARIRRIRKQTAKMNDAQ